MPMRLDEDERERRRTAVLVVGIAAIDIIYEVEEYPEEDSKIRALATRRTRGGNGTNALVVCAQLGCECYWIGMSTEPGSDPDAALVHQELSRMEVNCSLVTTVNEGAMPVSFILTSRSTGSRTIIHSRKLPELSLSAFQASMQRYNELAGHQGRWIHFEGRDMENVRAMMEFLRTGNCSAHCQTISVEIEALRYDWPQAARLLHQVDYAFVSKDYTRKKVGFSNSDDFFDHLLQHEFVDQPEYLRAVIVPWGSHGVYALDLSKWPPQRIHVPAHSLSEVVDSVGAGDSFIGATIAALSQGVALNKALGLACQVAASKCQQYGFEFEPEKATGWVSELLELANLS